MNHWPRLRNWTFTPLRVFYTALLVMFVGDLAVATLKPKWVAVLAGAVPIYVVTNYLYCRGFHDGVEHEMLYQINKAKNKYTNGDLGE